MNYQKEYAHLIGQMDRAITLLEQNAPIGTAAREAADLLTAALRTAEERYIQGGEEAEGAEQMGA